MDDTHPAVRARIDAMFAAMSPADRFAAMASMTEFVVTQSRAALAAAMPEATEQERLLRWSELHYGATVTDRVRAFLAERR